MKVVLQNVTKIFPSRNKKVGGEVVAVNDFTYEIPDGKLVGLLGPSGCGKSTTLYMICGLQKCSGGRIFFGENDVTDLTPENRGVGLVFQNYALYLRSHPSKCPSVPSTGIPIHPVRSLWPHL